jgi:hypothetical protein
VKASPNKTHFGTSSATLKAADGALR